MLTKMPAPESVFPNYGPNAATRLTDHETAELAKLRTTYQKQLSEYARLERVTFEGTRGVVENTMGGNPASGNNARLSDGTVGFVTPQGVFKPYPSATTATEIMGVNGCPATTTSVSARSTGSLDQGTMIASTPPMVVGSPMRVGQVCGNFGKNLEVEPNPDRAATFVSLESYTPSASSPMVYQSDISLADASMYPACRQRAIDLGADGFGLGYVEGDGAGLKCAVGQLAPPESGVGLRTQTGYHTSGSGPSAKFGLGPGAVGLTMYDDSGSATWSSTSRPECAANAAGSLIRNVSASYGANCNGQSDQVSVINQAVAQAQSRQAKGQPPCTIL